MKKLIAVALLAMFVDCTGDLAKGKDGGTKDYYDYELKNILIAS